LLPYEHGAFDTYGEQATGWDASAFDETGHLKSRIVVMAQEERSNEMAESTCTGLGMEVIFIGLLRAEDT